MKFHFGKLAVQNAVSTQFYAHKLSYSVFVWYWLGGGWHFNRCTQTGASVANNGREIKISVWLAAHCYWQRRNIWRLTASGADGWMPYPLKLHLRQINDNVHTKKIYIFWQKILILPKYVVSLYF